MITFDTLDSLANETMHWQRMQFPNATPASVAAHLLDEAGELERTPRDPLEMADVFILLIGLADATGTDLRAAIRRKLDINKRRRWGLPDERGVIKHIRGENGE